LGLQDIWRDGRKDRVINSYIPKILFAFTQFGNQSGLKIVLLWEYKYEHLQIPQLTTR